MTQNPDKLAQRIVRAQMVLRKNPTLLMNVAHPRLPGRSMRSYCIYLLRCAGRSGQTRACKLVEEAQRRREQPKLKLQSEGASP